MKKILILSALAVALSFTAGTVDAGFTNPPGNPPLCCKTPNQLYHVGDVDPRTGTPMTSQAAINAACAAGHLRRCP